MMVRLIVAAWIGLCCSSELIAQPVGEPTERGQEMIRKWMRSQAETIRKDCLKGVTTLAEWEKRRPELKRQFYEMMGLDPLPKKTDLKPVIVDRIENPKYTIEKIHFQSMPGLYVTGNLYIPKPTSKKAPTILYVCGHSDMQDKGIFYGNKTAPAYQAYAARFAEQGYVCFIIDTLQLGELRGLHHGTYKHNLWWWPSVGYTPAGIELWNAIRALDYLETRPEVDAKRFGVTGRSGGGATSWWLAAADERIQCTVPVAGIADMVAQLSEGVEPRLREGVIAGHCDCMFFINTYRWDFGMVAALIAPRPCLLGNTDQDPIFPVAGYQRIAEQVRPVYALYQKPERFALLEAEGPHKDSPKLQQGTFEWFQRWLTDKKQPIEISDFEPLPGTRLKVIDRTPADAINDKLHEQFRTSADWTIPPDDEVAGWWKTHEADVRKALQQKVFHNWPTPGDMKWKHVGEEVHNGLKLRGYDYTTEAGVELRLWLLNSVNVKQAKILLLDIADDEGYREWCENLGKPFAQLLQADITTIDDAKQKEYQRTSEQFSMVTAIIVPRGIGPTRWAKRGSNEETQFRRRFPLLGQTLESQQVWDIKRAIAGLHTMEEFNKVPRWVQGKRDMAVLGLYAAADEPEITRLDLWYPPESHRSGPSFINNLTYLDMPQAVMLAAPKRVYIYLADEQDKKGWVWPIKLQQQLGMESLKFRIVKD